MADYRHKVIVTEGEGGRKVLTPMTISLMENAKIGDVYIIDREPPLYAYFRLQFSEIARKHGDKYNIDINFMDDRIRHGFFIVVDRWEGNEKNTDIIETKTFFVDENFEPVPNTSEDLRSIYLSKWVKVRELEVVCDVQPRSIIYLTKNGLEEKE